MTTAPSKEHCPSQSPWEPHFRVSSPSDVSYLRNLSLLPNHLLLYYLQNELYFCLSHLSLVFMKLTLDFHAASTQLRLFSLWVTNCPSAPYLTVCCNRKGQLCLKPSFHMNRDWLCFTSLTLHQHITATIKQL